MAGKKCPVCGQVTLVEMSGEYRMEPPPNIPGGAIVVHDSSWLHCESCNEDILSSELDAAINREGNRRLGITSAEGGSPRSRRDQRVHRGQIVLDRPIVLLQIRERGMIG
jgi:hypothetical protein